MLFHVLANSIGRTRFQVFNGRGHLVVPVVALVEGVIHAVNATVPEFVSAEALAIMPQAWNGRPLVLGHPMRDGKQISANDATVLEKQSFGTIFNARVENKRLLMDAYIDPLKAEQVGGKKMLEALQHGEMVEVSVGAFVTTLSEPGEYKGKKFEAKWQTIAPDHLAFLPDGRGACSIDMGCGVPRAAVARDSTFRALLQGVPPRVLAGGGDHPFTYCMETIVPAIEEKHGAIDDPNAFCGFWKAERAAQQFEQQKKGGRPMDKRTLRARVKSLLGLRALDDTASEAASEEAAELIGYKAIQSLLDSVAMCHAEASMLVSDLIADEVENPTETPEDEDAEEEVEAARLEAIQMQCYTMTSALSNVLSMTYKLLMPEPIEASDPRYMEALRAAVGARNSAKDLKTLQNAHDATHEMHGHTVALGAECNGMKLLERGHDCGCQGGETMTKEQRAATIKALVEHTDSGLMTDDTKWLEHMPDARLEALDVQVKGGLRTAATKAEAEKVIKDKHTADTALADHAMMLKKKGDAKDGAKDGGDDGMKGAEAKPLTEEDFLKLAPPSLKALIERTQARDAARKIDLIEKLKTAQSAYTEKELAEQSLDVLERLALVAKLDLPQADFSGRGMPRAAASEPDVFSHPPNPYSDEALKAYRAKTN